MWDLENMNLPPSLKSYFTKANSIHNINTRFASSGKCAINTNDNTFQSIGTKINNQLINNQAFSVANKSKFLANIKEKLISTY